MFERFTKEARAAVAAAQQVARDTGSRTVDSRHVLVALAEGPGPARAALAEVGAEPDQVARRVRSELRTAGLDPRALATLGIDLDAVRDRVEATFGPGALEGAARTRAGHIPFAPDAKKALELALREAIRLEHRTIDGRHLLLGILRAECPARDALRRADIALDDLRGGLEDADVPGSRSA